MKLFKQQIQNFGAAHYVYPCCPEVFPSTRMLKCKQQQKKLKGIATACSAGKQTDPKCPKTNPLPTFWKTTVSIYQKQLLDVLSLTLISLILL